MSHDNISQRKSERASGKGNLNLEVYCILKFQVYDC